MAGRQPHPRPATSSPGRLGNRRLVCPQPDCASIIICPEPLLASAQRPPPSVHYRIRHSMPFDITALRTSSPLPPEDAVALPVLVEIRGQLERHRTLLKKGSSTPSDADIGALWKSYVGAVKSHYQSRTGIAIGEVEGEASSDQPPQQPQPQSQSQSQLQAQSQPQQQPQLQQQQQPKHLADSTQPHSILVVNDGQHSQHSSLGRHPKFAPADLSEVNRKLLISLLEQSTDSPTKVDQVSVDVLSLFFKLWTEQKKVPPGFYRSYVQLSKLHAALKQLNQSGLFTSQILSTHVLALAELAESLRAIEAALAGQKDGIAACYLQGMSYMKEKYQAANNLLSKLKSDLSNIDAALIPILEKLVEIQGELARLLTQSHPTAFSLSEIHDLQEHLNEIDSFRINGAFVSSTDGSIPSGQAHVTTLLENCFEDCHELLAQRDEVTGDNPLRSVYEKLIQIKARLEDLVLVRRWTIRPEDLVPLQMELGQIDNLRVDGKFLDEHGNIPEGQAILHFLIHKCYRLIQKLQMSSEPVSEDLMPILRKLQSIRQCLMSLCRWKITLSMRELIPYQIALAAIDNGRRDGKFLSASGEVPEGQGILHELLSHCYDLLDDLRREALSNDAPKEESDDELFEEGDDGEFVDEEIDDDMEDL
ncbi:uncharacterized protein BJ171DRAFT_513124 [Polychytrium aggregatum]|uniref:uncharacterized protein n=1 Tax=Polychytrium aggregatum TaxID=110093 RepID=UPI0022FDF610|nr:uncharacterized protein BJ171DRAFT_513124 [Polychytrium aggregatum]KAI9202752.1 hypothetical protein BJ171DRAFT_513124 [Polychytrium aggregatum]